MGGEVTTDRGWRGALGSCPQIQHFEMYMCGIEAQIEHQLILHEWVNVHKREALCTYI